MILVTGAAGFVGKAVCASLSSSRQVRACVRRGGATDIPDGVDVSQKLLLPDEEWRDALVGVKTVIHCAARVHVMKDKSTDPLMEFRRVNVEGTLRLANQAASLGVDRFVFVSSIKVNGEETQAGQSFSAEHSPAPVDPYGLSKMEAEQGLRAIASKSGMEIVIVRPPLVYGPGVKANFRSIMRWLSRGWPLPLGAITDNRRSFVGMANLVDLLVTCIDHPAAANRTFLVSDGEDLSTAALLQRIGMALGMPAKLIPFPPGLLKWGGAFLGRPGVASRLCGSLQVDISFTKKVLGWSPPVSVDQELHRTAQYWLRSQK
ncbi:UDP-glucose 4-epimerase family protein [Propionivibrio soli]|uniref:UDP-glucose 4-epimerase family protein n=1 Tax=Propionivibrio soli TaxID=2976531 RepID=UPI0021E801BE|nr:SDR family oxidoreductase [Propionivibrio soli]